MKLNHFPMLGALAAVTACGAVLVTVPAASALTEEEQQDTEILTRGPVHEAFAETVTYRPEPGVIIHRAPPAAIEELPPDQQLEGDNVAWIPGYWGWDDDATDFLWVSGIWRNLPPGRQWVPGYWNEAGSDYQWTSGYWADDAATEVSYLPEPPVTVEAGPNIAATSDDQIWIPGVWVWNTSRYAWRAGYWQASQPNWIWSPAHYVWTRRGYVFVDGYWDYAVPRRGVLFAPVRFHRDVYARPGYSYSPLTVIALSVFSDHLFLRPNYGHYYFGDYYAPRYRDTGFYPSYSYNAGRRGYDPFFAYQRWEHRRDRDWERRRGDEFAFFRDNENARPPRTWAALRAMPEPTDPQRRKSFGFAEPLDRFVKDKPAGPMRFQTLDKKQREKFVTQKQEMQRFGQERRKLEGVPSAFPGASPDKRAEGERVKLTRSPIAGKPVAKLGKADTPPKRPVMRKFDPKITPPGAPGGADTADRKDLPDRGQGIDRQGGPDRKDAPGRKDATSPEDRTRPGPGPKTDAVPGRGKPGLTPKPSKDESKPERKIEPRQEPKTVPEAPRKVQPRPEPKPEPQESRKAEPKPERKVQPERQTVPESPRKIEPRQTPKAEPRPSPKPEPRQMPKAEPRPSPKPEPRQMPKVQPQPQPSPRAVPRQAPKGQPDSNDKKDERGKGGGRGNG